jgi:hypothetical protein
MHKENVRKRRGRPPLPTEQVRRHAIAIRTTKNLVDRLKEAGEASGRSLAREIEHRLEQSFEVQGNYDRLIARFAEMEKLLIAETRDLTLGAPEREQRSQAPVVIVNLHGHLSAEEIESLAKPVGGEQADDLKPLARALERRSLPMVLILGAHDQIGADERDSLTNLVGAEVAAELLSELDEKDQSVGSGER